PLGWPSRSVWSWSAPTAYARSRAAGWQCPPSPPRSEASAMPVLPPPRSRPPAPPASRPAPPWSPRPGAARSRHPAKYRSSRAGTGSPPPPPPPPPGLRPKTMPIGCSSAFVLLVHSVRPGAQVRPLGARDRENQAVSSECVLAKAIAHSRVLGQLQGGVLKLRGRRLRVELAIIHVENLKAIQGHLIARIEHESSAQTLELHRLAPLQRIVRIIVQPNLVLHIRGPLLRGRVGGHDAARGHGQVALAGRAHNQRLGHKRIRPHLAERALRDIGQRPRRPRRVKRIPRQLRGLPVRCGHG